MDCQYAANCPPPPPPPHGGIGTAESFHTLPFTGAELTMFIVVALTIIASGIVLRMIDKRYERIQRDSSDS